MKAPRTISQQVRVDVSCWDNGLRALIREAVGAPKGASVNFHERGVSVVWERRKRA